MTQVRIATREDEPEIIRLLHIMHAENALLSLNVEAAREMFALAFNRQGGIIGVIGPTNNIEGIICLVISRLWYTRDNHLEEVFNFIRPDCRRSDHAKVLIDFAKECAEKIGIPLLIGVLTNRRMETKVRLYRRKLGMPAGAFFVHNASWANDGSGDDLWKAHSRGRNKIKDLITNIASAIVSTLPLTTNGAAHG